VAALLSGCAVAPRRPAPEEQAAQAELLAEARAWMEERRCSVALDVLAQAIRRAPADAKAHYLKGQCLFRMTRYPEAAAAYRESLSVDGRHYPSQVGLWSTRLAQSDETGLPGLKTQIRREARALLDERPDDPPTALAAAEGYVLLGDWDAANALLVRMVEEGRYRGHEDAVAGRLFSAVRAERDAKERIRLADLYVTRFPDTSFAPVAARLLFATLEQRPQPAESAREYARRYLALQGSNPELSLAVAWGLLRRGQDPARAASLLAALEDNESLPVPVAAEIRYLHGLALLSVGDPAAARDRFQAAIALDRYQAKAHYELGLLAMEGGRTDEAVSRLREVMRLSDRLPDALERLGALLETQRGFRGDPRDYFALRERVPRFEDATDAAGLRGVLSGRVAWGDYDGDGYDDLLLDGPRLFRNDGGGGFEEVTAAAGLSGLQGSTGGLWGDYDNDADLDLFLFSRRGSQLLANDGWGGFQDVTELALPPLGSEQAEAAAWGDVDNDGYLDLYLASYERPLPIRGVCARDRLLRNRGNGSFEDATERAGAVSDEPLCGRGVVWADIDGDGWQDILVSNYRLDPNLWWRNRGDGTFVDSAAEAGFRGHNVSGLFGHSIGSVVGDLDGDGHLDVFVSNLAHPEFRAFSDVSMLLLSGGVPDGALADRFDGSGIRFEETSSDPALADVDDDGDLDLFVTSIYPGRNSHLYLNDGHAGFTDVSWVSGTRVENGWGAAFADFDRDGDMDLLVASSDGVRLLRNSGSRNHWLLFESSPAPCHGLGIGSRVLIEYGGRQQTGMIFGGKGTGVQEPSKVHFGLGSYTGVVRLDGANACGDRFRAIVSGVDRAVRITGARGR
jgi:tetratricopeptide (TPR) repeat protein